MNPLKEKLLRKEPVFGVLSPSSDPVIVEMFANTQLDYFMIEGEHAYPNPSQIANACRAADNTGITTLARVRSNDAKLILQYLDAGVKGIMLPGIVDSEEVKSFTQSLFYPPKGKRGLGPSRANDYLMASQTIDHLISQTNNEIISIIQIETKESYKNLDSILNVTDIHCVVIGTVDLALSLNLPVGGQDMEKITTTIINQCSDKGITAGLVATSNEQRTFWTEKGVRFFIDTPGNIIQQGADYS